MNKLELLKYKYKARNFIGECWYSQCINKLQGLEELVNIIPQIVDQYITLIEKGEKEHQKIEITEIII